VTTVSSPEGQLSEAPEKKGKFQPYVATSYDNHSRITLRMHPRRIVGVSCVLTEYMKEKLVYVLIIVYIGRKGSRPEVTGELTMALRRTEKVSQRSGFSH
jgi:hypothetical protein